jgi:AraC family transcriptional activator of pobA
MELTEYRLTTPLKGNVILTYHFHEQRDLQRDKSLYKFFWVLDGTVTIEVDHVPIVIRADEIVPLTPLHHVEVKEVGGTYLCLLFNSNFYCIYGHDSEVSCNGFLFQGSSHIMHLKLSPHQAELLRSISDIFKGECGIQDDLQEEMLRIVLKRFIITCTRIARSELPVQYRGDDFELVRQFNVLVDLHFREMKQVKDYADLLHRSPKTLSNAFAVYGLPSPLQVIHERVEAEARRLILYTSKSAKEIADILGFDDLSSFSRFFKKKTGSSISDYRKMSDETKRRE